MEHTSRRSSHGASGFRMQQLRDACEDLKAKLRRSKKVVFRRWGLMHREIKVKSLLSLWVPCWKHYFHLLPITCSILHSRARFYCCSSWSWAVCMLTDQPWGCWPRKWGMCHPEWPSNGFFSLPCLMLPGRESGCGHQGCRQWGMLSPFLDQAVQTGEDYAGKIICHHLIKILLKDVGARSYLSLEPYSSSPGFCVL